MNFSWAKNFPEVHRVCNLFNLTELTSPIRYSYKSLMGYIQDGPQCGLVALAMCIGIPDKPLIQEILEIAKDRGYTNNGEMFSAKSMCELARTYLKTTNVEICTGSLNSRGIQEQLLKGALLLVPYDTDKDNSPSIQNGHKAHWCVVCGAIETETDFYVIARHGKVRNVAIWRLSDLAESNGQLNEIGQYQRQPDMEFKVPEGGIAGPLGLKGQSVILTS